MKNMLGFILSVIVILYYSPKCPHSQKVLSFLHKEQISIPMEDVLTNSQAREQLKAISGYNVVPCLVVDGQPIFEDTAIIDWLIVHKSTLAKSAQ